MSYLYVLLAYDRDADASLFAGVFTSFDRAYALTGNSDFKDGWTIEVVPYDTLAKFPFHVSWEAGDQAYWCWCPKGTFGHGARLGEAEVREAVAAYTGEVL